MKLEPGDVAYSKTSLSKRWQWNERTVSAFLGGLCKRQIIQSRINNVTTVISIKNYDIYQKGTEQSTEQSTEQTQSKVQTNKNVKNERSNTTPPEFDLLWAEYPKRLGKKEALRHFNASVKSDVDLADIKLALANYKASVAGKDVQYIQNGSTWFNNWRDWVEQHQIKGVDEDGDEIR